MARRPIETAVRGVGAGSEMSRLDARPMQPPTEGAKSAPAASAVAASACVAHSHTAGVPFAASSTRMFAVFLSRAAAEAPPAAERWSQQSARAWAARDSSEALRSFDGGASGADGMRPSQMPKKVLA